MDKILEKHLANALVLVKSDLNISSPDENIIPYYSCIFENKKYKVKTEFEDFTSEIIGYWKDKPIIKYNGDKYTILENSNTIVKLKSLNITDDKIQKQPDIKVVSSILKTQNIIAKPNNPVVTKNEEPTTAKVPTQSEVIKDLNEILPKKETEQNSVISHYVNTLKNTDKQKDNPPKSDVPPTSNYMDNGKQKSLEEEIFSLLDSKKDDPRIKRLFSYYTDQTKKEVHEINEKYSKQYLAKILETSGGGGTSNSAVDYSKGGTIDGSLTITQNLSVLGSINNKRVFIIGNDIDTEYTVDHNFNTKDLVISVYDSNDEIVLTSIKNINLNQTFISFGNPVKDIKVVIMC